MDNVDFLPVWKKDSTAEEWLSEIQSIARKYPKRFEKVAMVAVEKRENGNLKTRIFSRGCNTLELLGIFENGKNIADRDSEV